MPAEWEPHSATWLAWPHHKLDWPRKFEPIPWVFAEIIRYISHYERVELIVQNELEESGARKILKRADAWNENVRFHRWPTDRVWTRDSGCSFIVSHGALAAACWRFNAWAKYSNWKRDVKIGSRMAESAGAEKIQPKFRGEPVVLEGGAIEVNGAGSMIVTEECLLSTVQQRNPAMKKRDYENVFLEYLGATNVIWLKAGIVGDDTHGHIDDIARFVSRDTIVTCVDADPASDNHLGLRENLLRLRRASSETGNRFTVVDLPMPRPMYFDGQRLPASYANFYIANGLVLVPVFNDANDRIALDILANLFPEREVVGIYCGDLIWGFGAIHCMTQQQPAAGD